MCCEDVCGFLLAAVRMGDVEGGGGGVTNSERAVGSMAPLYVCVHSLAPLFFVGAYRVRREEVLVDLVCRIEMASRCWVPALVHVFSIVPVHV